PPTNKRRSLRPNGTNKRQQVHTVGRGGFQTRPRAANAARRYDQIVSRGQVRRSKKIDHICRSTHYHPHRLRSGLPKRDGMRSSRNKSSWALAPMPCPPSLLSGTITSAASCQVFATYA